MRARWWMVILVGVLLVVAASVRLPPRQRVLRHHLWRALTVPFPDDIQGTIQAHGKTLGDFQMQPDECNSGDWHDFYGIEFFDGSQPGYAGHISTPVDGEPNISINAPAYGYALEFSQGDCSVWDVGVKRTSSFFRDNSRGRILPVAGHARFSCFHPDTGAKIDGDLHFRYCR